MRGTRGEVYSPEEILEVHEQMWQAIGKRDLDKWSAYVAEDCIFSNEEGEITTRSELIGHLRTLPREYDRSENRREFIVRVYGKTAVLNFRLTAHEQFTDADIITEFRETETFVRQSGSWKLVAVQWGALPVSFRKPGNDRPVRVQDYAGDFEWPGGPYRHKGWKIVVPFERRTRRPRVPVVRRGHVFPQG